MRANSIAGNKVINHHLHRAAQQYHFLRVLPTNLQKWCFLLVYTVTIKIEGNYLSIFVWYREHHIYIRPDHSLSFNLASLYSDWLTVVKEIVHSKMKILSLITPPLCRFKPVRPSFIFGTQIKIFWWNPLAFWPCIDSNTTTIFKAQKGSKDIIKTVHVTSVVQP